MFKNNAIDFDDMLLLTVRILKENIEARKAISNKFKYILVDEFQDTNLVQFEIIKLLTTETDNLITVVGDDDQSIYKFRGANIGNILSFEEVFKDAKLIYLTKNYRSTNNILKVANRIIVNNKHRKNKELWSDNGDGAKVLFTEYYDDTKEAYSIISDIKKKNDYKNTAILYRANSQSRKFEEMCVSMSVPYTLVGGVNFYERREIKDILAYMYILVNPSDTNSLFRIINVPKRGIGESTIKKILEYAGENNITPFEAIFNINNISLSDKIKEKIKSFIDLIIELKNENDIDAIIDTIMKRCYEDFLVDEYGDEEAKERIDNIDELRNKAITFKNTYPDRIENEIIKDMATNLSAKVILEDFLYEIALLSDADEADDSDDRITLMSFHASKGLEFDTVYMTGMNEGIFPSYQSISENDADEIEEERRLCYVGITRAKKNLYLTAAKRRMLNGKYNQYMPSRFIDEIDDSLITKNFLSINEMDSQFLSDDPWSYKSNHKKYNSVEYSSLSVSKNELKKNIDTYKTGANIIKATELDYNVGDIVNHIKFGNGKVISIEDIGRDFEVTVEFEDFGSKTLFAAFAKLKKV